MPTEPKKPKRDRSAWFAFYPDDFAGGTRDMSLAGRGAFLALLSYQFANGSVPDDDLRLCRIAGAFPDEWQAVRSEVLAKFQPDGQGGLVNARMEKERTEREEIREKRIQAANSSHVKRWGKSESIPYDSIDESQLTAAQLRSKRLAKARQIATHTPEEWAVILEFCGGCVKCGCTESRLVKDHIKPIYQGGSDGIENLQPLCARCNSSKGPDATDYRKDGWQNELERLAKRPAQRLASTTTTTDRERERNARVAPCTVEQARAAAEASMIPADLGEEWWHDRESKGWTVENHAGTPRLVADKWRSDLVPWCRTVQANRSKFTASPNGQARQPATGRPGVNRNSQPGNLNDPSEYDGF